MSIFPKNHPFPVEAYFDSTTVLSFAVPKAELEPLIPECLELDTFDDTWGFIAMAIVRTKHLRPKGFPKFLGNDFFLIGFRIFVRYHTSWGKRLRGLYILRSETNKKKMEFLGNFFTSYNYTTTDITEMKNENGSQIFSEKSNFKVVLQDTVAEVTLPEDSPFSNWKEARRFAGPLPFTFSYNESKSEVLIIEGVRSNWTPEPLHVVNHSVSFLDALHLKEIKLANAFRIEQVPYHWKKGKTDPWKP